MPQLHHYAKGSYSFHWGKLELYHDARDGLFAFWGMKQLWGKPLDPMGDMMGRNE